MFGALPLQASRPRNLGQPLGAPTGGWNARDPLADMDPLDAVRLVNMFPAVSSCNLRGGHSEWVTGLGSQVETLMAYQGAATQTFFAIAGTSVYNVTSSGAVGAAVLAGLTNARWEYTNVATSGGNYLYMVNGVNSAYTWDGTTWANPVITGVTSADLSNILLFKNRIWFVEKNSLRAWYLPTNSIAGAAQALDMRAVARRGGYIVALGAWTVDAGYGADDMLVAITSQGEAIVWRGTDPSSAGTWASAGVWQLGSPIGKRCMLKYGGDLLLITYDGVVPLSKALQSSRVKPNIAVTDKIQGAMSDATALYASNFGWQLFFNAKYNALHLNVPVGTGQQQQFVMNSITENWCQFTGWYANCFEEFQNTPYFGGNGVVYKCWTTDYTDDDAAIPTEGLQAFNYFKDHEAKKIFTRLRPSISSDGVPSSAVGINVDFDTSDTTAPLTFSPVGVALWDTGRWDTGIWGSGLTVANNWQGVAGIGTCGAVHLKTASMGLQVQWNGTDVIYQKGFAGV